MALDVGTLDLPSSPYRPDLEVGVEVLDAIVIDHLDYDDRMRSIWFPRIIYTLYI